MNVLSSSDHVVVVGAGLAGWRLVEGLRREGFDGEISLVGDEPHLPYDRPPLTKQVLSGKWTSDRTALVDDDGLATARVRGHFGVAASDLDVSTTTVHLTNGTAIEGTHVVLATGVRARRLAYSADERIHTLRSRDDVDRLDGELARVVPGSTVAVIGGGFIGAEVATSLKLRGYRPVVLEAAARPLAGVLGDEVSTWLERLAGEAGIELRTRQSIIDVRVVDDGLMIDFNDASVLRASVVIEGVGALPNVEWLATSGLTIDNGVVVNEHLIATDRVAAIGDVARFEWASPTGVDLVRIEHWQIASDHATTLARYWMGVDGPSVKIVPYFWSDQYGRKIQVLGHPAPGDEVHRVRGGDAESKWLALYSQGGVVTGAVALNSPRALMMSKGLLDVRTSLGDAMARAPWSC